MLESHDERMRKEGMADAAVLLTAKKIIRGKTLDEWCIDLGVSDLDKQHAVRRLQARAVAAQSRTTPAPKLRAVAPVGTRITPGAEMRRQQIASAEAQRQAILATLQRLGGSISSNGFATPELRVETGLDITHTVFIGRIVELADAGLITRVIRGKRTYSITLVQAEVG